MTVVTNLAIPQWSPVEVAVVLIISCILRAVFAFCKSGYNPSKVPVVGLPSGIFGRLRAVPQVFGRGNQIILDGFTRYSRGKNPTAFLAPWNLTNYIYILPPQLVSEHKSIPEHTLSLVKSFLDENGSQAMGVRKFHAGANHYQVALIRQKLTGSLGRLLESVREELELAFKEEWEQMWVGKEQEGGWVDVAVFPAAMDIVARTSNRAFSGDLLCQNKPFLKNAVDYAVGIIIAGYGVQLCPRELQWLLEPLISFRNRRRLAFARKILTPIIEERRAIIEHNMKNKQDQVDVPVDLLQHLVEEGIKIGPPCGTTEDLTVRYLNMNFVALHSTSMTFAHTLANMAAFRDSTGQSYWELLREEVLAVDRDSEEGPGIWTKKKLQKLVGMDSVIRESLRLDMTPAIGMVRKVLPKEGYTYSNGLHLKQGVTVGVPTLCIHRDQDGLNAGGNAAEFNGFRFSRPYQELSTEVTSAASGIGKYSSITTSEQYLPFGHGKHACPGRFFAVWEVKMFLMHCVVKYDLKPHERVSGRYVWGKQRGHMDIKLKLRMRRESNVSTIWTRGADDD